MKLLKDNIEKGRCVYQFKNGLIRKYWRLKDLNWLEKHVKILHNVVPGYVENYGINELGVWIDTCPLPGINASIIPHTDEFILKIYNFCLQNIKDTAPYVHGDWVLTNMLVDGEDIYLCDWDNVGIYPIEEVMKKIVADLESAFGPRFKEVINDPTSI